MPRPTRRSERVTREACVYLQTINRTPGQGDGGKLAANPVTGPSQELRPAVVASTLAIAARSGLLRLRVQGFRG